LGVRRKADELALQKKKNIVAKSKEVEAGWSNSQEWTNLEESFKEGYGSKRDVLPMMMMILLLLLMTYHIFVRDY
jgi:hypothetical protein